MGNRFSRVLRRSATALTVVAGLASGAANATLIDEGNGQLYDNVTSLVWLQDANLAKTNTFGVSGIDSDGHMNLSAANSWIAAMDAANYLGHKDWMLPITAPVAGGNNWNDNNYSYDGSTDSAYNITSEASQLSYMYYVNLGLKGAFSPSGTYQPDYGIRGNGTTGGQANVGLVDNLQSNVYWSGTEYEPDPAVYARGFATNVGFQGLHTQIGPFAAWAVRPADSGDVADIPEPASLALLYLGLVGLGFGRRKKAKQVA